jgi:hypothetical protein
VGICIYHFVYATFLTPPLKIVGDVDDGYGRQVKTIVGGVAVIAVQRLVAGVISCETAVSLLMLSPTAVLTSCAIATSGAKKIDANEIINFILIEFIILHLGNYKTTMLSAQSLKKKNSQKI